MDNHHNHNPSTRSSILDRMVMVSHRAPRLDNFIGPVLRQCHSLRGWTRLKVPCRIPDRRQGSAWTLGLRLCGRDRWGNRHKCRVANSSRLIQTPFQPTLRQYVLA